MPPATAIKTPAHHASRLLKSPINLGLAIAAGIVVGFVAVSMAALEARWILFPCAAMIIAGVVAAAPDRRRLLATSFVLSLQVNVAFRLFHGRAGSDGIALFLPAVIGGVLLAYYLIATGRDAAAFRLAGSLGTPIAILLGTTFFSLMWTNERFVGLTYFLLQLELYVVYCVALNIVRSEADIERILKLLLITLALQSIVYMVQSALGITFTFTGQVLVEGPIPRPGGTVSTNPAGFASFIMPPLFLAIARFLTTRSRAESIYLVTFVAAGVIALVITYTRAAWGAFILGGAVLAVLAQHRGYLKIGRVLVPALAGLTAVLMFNSTIQARLTGSPLEEAYQERSALMRMAVNTIAANPLTGVGPGAYEHAYKAYLTGNLSDAWKWKVHNEFLLRAAECGVPGGVAFIGLLLCALRVSLSLVDVRRPIIASVALGWSGALVALAFQMYWVPWTGFAYNAMLWMMLGIVDAAKILNAEGEAGVSNGVVARRPFFA